MFFQRVSDFLLHPYKRRRMQSKKNSSEETTVNSNSTRGNSNSTNSNSTKVNSNLTNSNSTNSTKVNSNSTNSTKANSTNSNSTKVNSKNSASSKKTILVLDNVVVAAEKTVATQDDAYKRIESFVSKYVDESTDTASVSYKGTQVQFRVQLNTYRFAMTMISAENMSSGGGHRGPKRPPPPPLLTHRPHPDANKKSKPIPPPLTLEWTRTGITNSLLPVEIVASAATASVIALVVQFLRVLFGKGAGATLEDHSWIECGAIVASSGKDQTARQQAQQQARQISDVDEAKVMMPVRAFMKFSTRGETYYNDLDFKSFEQKITPDAYEKHAAALRTISVNAMFNWIQNKVAIIDSSLARQEDVVYVMSPSSQQRPKTYAFRTARDKIENVRQKLTDVREHLKWATESLVLLGRKSTPDVCGIIESTAAVDCERCRKLLFKLSACDDMPWDIMSVRSKNEICAECEQGKALYNAIVFVARLSPVMYCDL